MEKEQLEQLTITSLEIARVNNQVVGEKNDYYITIEQLNDLLMAIRGEQGDNEILVNTILDTKNKEIKDKIRDTIQGILDDTANTNEDVWTGSEIREYLEKKLKNL